MGQTVRLIEFQGLLGFSFESISERHGLRHVYGARNDRDKGNLALSGGRDRHAALATRAVWSDYIRVDPKHWVVGGQTHTANVVVVDEEHRGRGACSPDDVIAATDGLFTTCRGLPLYVAVADCSAVLLTAPGALAVVHGGWRGLATGIMGEAIKRFDEHGIKIKDIRAGVAPCIAATSYEVGPEVAGQCPDSAKHRGRDDRWQVDIAKWAAAELLNAGIDAENIEMSGLDTGSDQRLFSHRRQGEGAGRNGLIAVLA